MCRLAITSRFQRGGEALTIGGAVKYQHRVAQLIAEGPPDVTAPNRYPQRRAWTRASGQWTPSEGNTITSTAGVVESRVVPQGRRDGHRRVLNGFDKIDPVDDGPDRGPHALTVDNNELDVIKEAK